MLRTVECGKLVCDSKLPTQTGNQTSVLLARTRALPALGLGLLTAFCGGATWALPPFVPVSPQAQADSSTSPDPDRASLPQVTIEAQREALRRRVNGFVEGITHNPRYYEGAIPRWRAPLCFAVAGLPDEEGALVLARLSQIAASAGARVARRNCEYNFYLVLTSDPDQLIKRIYRGSHSVFDRDAGMPAIRRFLSPSNPEAVRVWHNAAITSRHDMPTSEDASCGAISADNRAPPVSCQYEASRLARGDVWGLTLAFVIVDTNRSQGLSYVQLADYAAMVGLTDVEIDPDVGNAPTILRLFAESPESRPAGLTAWDRAFLDALYHTDESSLTQRSEIAGRIIQDVAPQ